MNHAKCVSIQFQASDFASEGDEKREQENSQSKAGRRDSNEWSLREDAKRTRGAIAGSLQFRIFARLMRNVDSVGYHDPTAKDGCSGSNVRRDARRNVLESLRISFLLRSLQLRQ
jgi:hypothetical protein